MDLVYTIASNVPFVLHCLWLRNCFDLHCSVVCRTGPTCWVSYRLYAGRLPPSVVSVSILREWISRTALYTSFFYLETNFPLLRRQLRQAVDELMQMWLQTEMEYVCRTAVQFRSTASAGAGHLSFSLSTKRPKFSWEFPKLQRCNEWNR